MGAQMKGTWTNQGFPGGGDTGCDWEDGLEKVYERHSWQKTHDPHLLHAPGLWRVAFTTHTHTRSHTSTHIPYVGLIAVVLPGQVPG